MAAFSRGVGDAGYGSFAGTTTWQNINFSQDGNFEVVTSPKKPSNGVNWLKTDDGVETILLRLTDKVWDPYSSSDQISIERVCDDCSIHPQPINPDHMVTLLNRTSQSLHDRTVSWTGIASRIWSLMPDNRMDKPRITPNGLTDQYSAFGKFELEDGEALLLTVPASDADYQGIQLGNLWFHSLEYQNRQSSLTKEQAYIDQDGIMTFVVSNKDPGVQNWLDPGGAKHGLIMIRWQGMDQAPASDMSTRIVDVEQVQEHLPASTPAFNAQQRIAQIRRRNHAVQQ